VQGLTKLSLIVSPVDKLSRPVQRMVGSFSNLDQLMERAQGLVRAGQRMGLTGAPISESAGKMRSSLMGPLEQDVAPLQHDELATRGVYLGRFHVRKDLAHH